MSDGAHVGSDVDCVGTPVSPSTCVGVSVGTGEGGNVGDTVGANVGTKLGGTVGSSVTRIDGDIEG